eukprot:1862986-Amphidinium_carterae.1
MASSLSSLFYGPACPVTTGELAGPMRLCVVGRRKPSPPQQQYGKHFEGFLHLVRLPRAFGDVPSIYHPSTEFSLLHCM